MEYEEFLKSKLKTSIDSGFEAKELHTSLFPFQAFIVRRALNAGRYAIFADCGLGKTFMQLEWARRVVEHTGGRVLILAPLAVTGQTVEEAEHWGIPLTGITVTNYEQLDNLDASEFVGVVLDESSILKNYTGKTKRAILEAFADAQFKLACTATPSPNDLNEIGNHSEFLNVMNASDMRMRWFVRDEGMNNYRLKAHAKNDFYSWIGSWSTILRNPADVGFPMPGYDLPELILEEHTVITRKQNNGQLFNDSAVNATSFNHELRRTKLERLSIAAGIANATDEQVIIWVKQNEEADELLRMIPGAVEVRGSDKPELKKQNLLGFGHGAFRVLITKYDIAQFGLNWQNCHIQVIASLDFSFEGFYQAVRRSYRFGQLKPVTIHLVTTDTMANVRGAIARKQEQFDELVEGIINVTHTKEYALKMDYNRQEVRDDWYHIINGDSVELIREVPSDSVDFSVFSPPFSTLFTYSDNLRDMGNNADDAAFFRQMQFLLKELYRIIKPGRLVAVHTKDLAVYKNADGYSGLYDFTGDFHRAMESVGFKYHSKVTIWCDPVLEMQRTKTQRLLYKTLTTDSTYTGIGMPEYVTIFRKWEGDEAAWAPVDWINRDNFPLEKWQQWASPVWMDIQRTDVLTAWMDARDVGDEKHICPLQLPVIERCVGLWTNPGDLVFTPFLGIGSELYQAVKMGRRGLGFELKESYFAQAKGNLESVVKEKDQGELF